MNQHQFNALVMRAKDAWEHMETFRLAYVANADQLARQADKLKWATISVGFLTGVCSVPIFLQVSATEYLVAVFGVVTGSLTLVDKHFRWEELSAQAWMNQKALDGLQRDLYNFVIDLGHAKAPKDPGLFIQQINEKAEKYTGLRIMNIGQWSAKAKEAVRLHGISKLTFTQGLDSKPDPDEFPTEDAEGIVEVTRG
ncbi:hypothetical protein [Gallaecimonas xiamenensis]|uniref:SMODS and SLOG-associating 2TM effector domain-containing protein n=1 Tax=Gallaecimonas xiamenensis 3-C-1 TaxID=745411 RepID=K2IZY3_9GAMM|nr:hypothetical protein [Gallaecimonas xiamenensis]EKE76141.1 hypothetical protein B3C1_04515 [Gallaecimonas xiamenensis 3-C-1]